MRSNLGESTITSTKKKITIGEEVDAVDTLGKQFLVWSNSFEEVIGKRNFYNISSLGSKVSIGISGVNNTACEHSLNLIHENFSILNFFEDKVAVPCSDTIVVDSEAFGRGVVEETNSVCNVHSNWISNKSFSTDNIPDNERVVILSTKGCKILFVEGERQRLDKHLVQLKSMHHLEGVEVPYYDVSLQSREKNLIK